MNNETKIITPEQEIAQRRERLARVTAEEKIVADAKKRREEQAAAQTAGVNESFFEKEARRAEEARNNKPIVLKRQGDAEASAAEAARYPRPAVNPMPVGDPFMDRETEASQRAAGYTPPKLKPSITLQPMPSKYPMGDPRAGMSEDLIVRMGMNPDPTKSALKK